MFIYSGKTPIYIPMPHSSSGYTPTQSYPLPCLIISLIVGVCAFIVALYLSKDEMIEHFDILLLLLLDICVGALIFILTYAFLGLIFVG